MRSFLPLVLFSIVLLALALRSSAEVYHSRESALELGFAGADSVTTSTLTLNEGQAEEASAQAGAELPSRLVQVYEAWKDGVVVSRGIIDTHRVRSLPQTLLIVADAYHQVRAVHLLAFHEPVQYRAPKKWFTQFEERGLDPEMAVRRGIAGIAGATMTSNAVTASVRRALATLRVSFECAEPESPRLTGSDVYSSK